MARVGLLEDNYRIAKLCAMMLSYANHDVTIYSDGLECLRAFAILDLSLSQIPSQNGVVEAASLPIDVLILDLHLPTITGLEVLHILRAYPHTCSLPLVFCTAAPDSEIKQAFTIAPKATLVEKPFKLQTLVAAIAQVLPASFQKS